MPTSQRTPRGVQDIQTHSGMAEQGFMPHKTFLRIACLEMEKARRGQERRSAMGRVQDIDRRFREIEAEKRQLLQALHQHDAGDSGPKRPAAVAKAAGCFKHRY